MLESLWTMRCQCFQSEGELMLSRSLVYVTCNVTCKVLCRSYARSCAGHMQLLHFTVSEASNHHYFILFFYLQEILPDSQEES